MIKFLLSLLLLTTSAGAEQQKNPLRIDRALYALQNSNYNCDAVINSIKDVKDFRYSWLYNTFDDSANSANMSCVNKINNLPQTKLMEVHLINEVCQRNKNCGSYEFLDRISAKDYQELLLKDDPVFLQKLNRYLETSKKRILPTLNKNIRCLISPGLESNLNKQAAFKLIEITRQHFKDRCEIVWNPVNNNKFSSSIPGTTHELHGHKVKLKAPCISNLDGVDIDLRERKSVVEGDKINESMIREYVKNYSHCEAAMIWIAEDNCLEAEKTDPRKRKNCTSKKLQEKLISIIK